MQGWSPDFVSDLTQAAVDEGAFDAVIPVAGSDALRLSRELATKEGIFTGTSGGATLAAALTVAERAPDGAHIVCMLPDTAERYLSTPLFEGILEDMNEEELALSNSTPGFRFAPAVSAPAKPEADDAAPAKLDPVAVAWVDEAIAREPVLMFALEWCEFCWSVRKLFARLGIDYHSADLDSVEFQEGDIGGKIRAVLKDRIGSPTIPQIWIGKTYIGGCTELFDAMREGRMQELLEDAGVDFDKDLELDPYSLLPGWLHPRKTG